MVFKFLSAAALSATILACPAWAVTQTVTSDPFDLEDLGFSRDVSGGDIPLTDTDSINPFDPANGTLEQILLDLERVSSVDGTLTYEITVGGVVVFSETITDADNGSVSLLSSADITNLFTK